MSCLIALCLQLSMGLSHAVAQDPGIWYMQGPQYPHELHIEPPSLSVGLAGEHWRAGYEYLGKFRADARAIASEDPALIACAPRCYPISAWHGAGKVGGLYLQATGRWGRWGAQLGPWVYRATWQEHITEFPLDATCGGLGTKHVASSICHVSTDKTALGAAGGLSYRVSERAELVASVWMASDRGSDRSIIKNMVGNIALQVSL